MIKHLMRSWDRLANDDALRAILTCEEQPDQRWEAEEFFATGEAKVADILAQLQGMDEYPNLNRALDFGCGVGRLTHALARHFQAADGVDVSRVMIEKAASLRKTPDNVTFIHNPRADLSQLQGDAYSFILSLISLQHMPERVALGYIGGMCDLLAPDGLAYLQVSTHLNPGQAAALTKLQRDASALNRLYRRVRGLLFRAKAFSSETHYCRLSEITRVLEGKRLRVVAVLPDASLPSRFVSHIVIFKKPAMSPAG